MPTLTNPIVTVIWVINALYCYCFFFYIWWFLSHGFTCQGRKVCRGQETESHNVTSFREPQQQSQHFALIAALRLLGFFFAFSTGLSGFVLSISPAATFRLYSFSPSLNFRFSLILSYLLLAKLNYSPCRIGRYGIIVIHLKPLVWIAQKSAIGMELIHFIKFFRFMFKDDFIFLAVIANKRHTINF